MRIGGNGSRIGKIGPTAETEAPVTEGSKGKGLARRRKVVRERCEATDGGEEGGVVGLAAGGIGIRAPIDCSEEVRDAVLDGLESK